MSVRKPPTHNDDHTTATPEPSKEQIRLSKFLSRAGAMSRRQAQLVVEEGRVIVNGESVRDPLRFVASNAHVVVDGVQVGPIEQTQVWCFHKPVRVLTARSDPFGRQTLYDFIPSSRQSLMPVGRLDNDSEGLLLLTNDGDLKQRLERGSLQALHRAGYQNVSTHGRPPAPIPRSYQVWVRPVIPVEIWENAATHGLTFDGVSYQPFLFQLTARTRAHMVVHLTLFEGKNREIRNIATALGLKVQRLLRVSYARIRLGALPPGKMYMLPPLEITRLQSMVGLEDPFHESPNDSLNKSTNPHEHADEDNNDAAD